MEKKDILKELNDSQREAVINYQGPCFIVAGPGSGKTKVLVSRTAYMLKEGISPINILLFTFTKKAANEIRERVAHIVDSTKAKLLTISTYHSFGARILRDNYDRLGYKKNFIICDEKDREEIIKKIVGSESKTEARELSSYLSYCKSNMITSTTASTLADPRHRYYSDMYSRYEKQLKKRNAFDFDDLIFKTILLLKNNNDILKSINKKYKYVTADESHDSSITDLELIKLLAGEDQHICMILDDEQSIYGFRYASVNSVISMRDYFLNCRQFILNKNYRSTDTIVKSSRSLISKNLNQIKKEISTDNEVGEKIMHIISNDPYAEASKVAYTIKFLMKKHSLDYKDIAILYRINSLSAPIEDRLLSNGIPYRMVKGRAFYNRKEVKDINSYLRFAYNPDDIESFCRIINVPKRGIGEKTLSKILEESEKTGNSIEEVCGKIKTTKNAKANLLEFISLIYELRTKIENMEDIKSIMKFLLEEIKYKEYLKSDTKVITKLSKNQKEEEQEKIRNIDQLIYIASQHENPIDFIENLSLLNDIDEKDPGNKVQLMTMHSSKGLEFPVVMMIGLNESSIPFYLAESEEEIEEERRLFYVGMTRAMKNLFLFSSEKLIKFGRLENTTPSRFIRNIDSKYIEQK